MSRDWRELRKHHSPIGSFLRYCSCHGCKHVHEHQDHTDGEEADRPSSKYSAHDKRQAHQETATPESAPSDSQEHLWDEAYQKLESKQQDLVGGFEKIIREEYDQAAGARLDDHTLGSVSIRPLLKTVIERKLVEMSQRSWNGQLPEPIENTIRIVQEFSGVVTLAVKNCPEAALAWSVVTLSLTFLTRPGEVGSSHLDGLAYVATRMEYFVAMESEVSKFPPPQQKMVSKSILELYSDVLEFQLHSVARLYRNRFKTLSRDLLDWDKWDEKLASLKQKESDVLRDAERIHRNLCRENLSKHHKELDRKFNQLLDFQKKQLEVSTQQLDVSTQQLNFVLSQDENECISSFARDYMGYKNDVSERIPGTCQWFVDHPKFHKFLSESGPRLLLVTADPGCGKSVLSKHLIDSVLPEKTCAHVCYYFFKDGHSDSMSLNVALCSMIHQLLRAKPALVKHAMKPFKDNGTELFKSDTGLRDILVNMATEENVVCVLDALDECEKNDLHHLCQFLDEPLKERKKPRLRFLMTSRPYDRITLEFHNQEDLRIPGEADETSGIIRQEISLVIQYKVKRLKDDLKLSNELAAEIEKHLFEVPHRTYLWVHLVFDDLSHETTSTESNSQNVYLQREHTRFKRTKKGIQERLQTLPTSLNQAYEKILSRAPEKDKERLWKAFCIILAARRPLTVSEMNIAMETTAKTCSWDDLDCERDEDFAQSRRNMAGLFISITGGKIYLIHQTAREFLQAKAQTTQYSRGEDSTWQNSIHMNEANHMLAKITCRYLYVLAKTLETPETEIPVFQEYAAEEWNNHCRDALMGDENSTRFYQWVIGALHKSQAPSESKPHDFDIGLPEPHNLLDEVLPLMVLIRYGPPSFVTPNRISKCLLKGNGLERNTKEEPFKKSGQALVESDSPPWNIFLDIATDPVCNGVLCVLDALDECSDGSLAMIRKLLNNSSVRRKESHLRSFMMTQPYDSIISKFQEQKDLRIPGEAEDSSGKISQEMSLVIHERIKSLKTRLNLDAKLATYLEKRLIEIPHRTYLWVHLAFDNIGYEPSSYHEKNGASKRGYKRFKITEHGINKALASTPTSITKAYEKILSRTSSEDDLRKALRIILAATRPLTVSEMNVAMEISGETKSWNDIDCEDDEQFAQRLKSLGGLFISITGGKICLIHQTAREFLLPKEGEESGSKSKWYHSIPEDEAQTEMRMIVSTYMRVLAEPAKDYSNYNEPKQLSEAPSFQLYCVSYCKSRDFGTLYLELWDKMIPFLPQEVVKMCTTNVLKMEVGKRIVGPVYGGHRWTELHFKDMLSDLAHSDPENPEFPLSDEAKMSRLR